ncbi:MAG: T9SS type A sorting domain-containing protein [Saprospiraceae bacterium]|nr:T9SS type A sorting domain-containing protein [Saprospiraceae bacterium]
MKSIKTIILAFGQLLPILCPAQYGQLDSTFSEDGTSFFHFQGGWAKAADMEVLPDGKILVAGTAAVGANKDSHILLLRYKEDGSLDTEFGDDGVALFDWNNQDDVATDLVVLPNGNILVSGYTKNASTWQSSGLLLRVKPNGILDNDFSGDGIFLMEEEYGISILQIIPTVDDQILLFQNDYSSRVHLTKLHETGLVDSLFGVGGSVYVGSSFSAIYSAICKVLENGHIIIIINLEDDTGFGYRTYSRLKNNGGLLSSNSSIDKNVFVSFEEILQDNIITSVGYKFDRDYHKDITINRFKIDGSYDYSFAINGTRLLDTGEEYEEAHALDLDKDKNIVLVGHDGHVPDQKAFIARLTSDGAWDNTFGHGGQFRLNYSTKEDAANSVQVDSKQRILVAGQSGDSLILLRLIGSDFTPPPLPPAPVEAYAFRLWPNPVGSILNIEYALPTSGLVTLELWDMQGRWIADLLKDAPRLASTYTVEIPIDAGIPNGAYWLRFKVGDFKAEQKIVILK